MNKKIKAELSVPIYHVAVVLIASDDIHAERTKANAAYGETKGGWSALCSRGDGGDFGLFFDARVVTHAIIAHEVLHLTLWILAYCEVKVSSKNDEVAAYLCGYLTEWVYRHLGRIVKK